jgi:uncharacterized membrane protein
MSLVQPLSELLRSLPSGVRRVLYVALTVIGAVLAAYNLLGFKDLGPITVSRALEAYAFLSSATGLMAVANVTQHPTATGVPDLDEDVDLSDFEPVGVEDDVYGPAAW